ncbi:MAG: STAS domain-containing protein, partial [Alphaproteobacteria bacterium]|nr:STAS domain-containing protein [Alphaproteobacteria bacterium]
TNIKSSQSSVTLTLPPVVDFGQTESLLDALVSAVEEAKDVVLDLDNVERVTSGPIQALLAAASTLDKNGYSLKVKENNEIFGKAMCDMGLKDFYDKWSIG